MNSSKPNKSGRRWRRRLANLLILVGLAVLLYPVGTWGYTWYQQRVLEQELEQAHPALATDIDELFEQDVTGFDGGSPGFGNSLSDLRDEKSDLRAEAREAEAERRIEELRRRADAFAEEVRDGGGLPIGKIQIPRIGVQEVVIQGTGTDDLREGPGHWPETPMPGQGGNFVISGHRTTYGAPFFELDELEEGDKIRIVLPYAAAEYSVTRSLIVSPREVEVVKQRGVEEISLTTCHPIYSAAQRLVVQAKLTGFKLLETPTVGDSSARG